MSYTNEISRPWQLFAGCVALLFGLPSLGLVAFAVWMLTRTSGDDALSMVVIASIFSVFGIPASLWGLRLVLGRRTSDGGMMSGNALRLAGVVILVLPVLYFAVGEVFHGAIALFHTGAAFTCFLLARRRSSHRLDPASAPVE